MQSKTRYMVPMITANCYVTSENVYVNKDIYFEKGRPCRLQRLLPSWNVRDKFDTCGMRISFSQSVVPHSKLIMLRDLQMIW